MYTFETNHITIGWYKLVDSVKNMILEHYNTSEYDDTLFLVNTLFVANENPEHYTGIIGKHKRVIYYNLEHSLLNTDTTNEDNRILDSLVNVFGVNEIWEMEYNSNFSKLAKSKYNIPVKYKPMRYTSLIKPIEDISTTPKSCDFTFIGTICTDYRVNFMKKVNGYFWNLPEKDIKSFKFISGMFNISNSIPEMNTSKYVLDVKRFDDLICPNQVRIFELLCMGYTVCVEKCPINMFPGLVYEWENINDLLNICNKNEYINPIEAYKEMTYTDEAYDNYVNYLIEQWNTLG